MKLKRIVQFGKPFHKIHEDPTKNYGVGSLTIRMVLKGKEGATQFVFSTGMYLPKTYDYWHVRGIDAKQEPQYTGYDVGYHSHKPMFDGHTSFTNSCEYLDGKKCYYDGSVLRAEKWMNIFLQEGEEAIWKMLEEDYNDLFIKNI